MKLHTLIATLTFAVAGPLAGWQVAHFESSACAPPLWATRPAGGAAA